MNLSKEPEPSIMDELDELEERIIREIEQKEKEMRRKDFEKRVIGLCRR